MKNAKNKRKKIQSKILKRFMIDEGQAIIRWPREGDLKDILKALREWCREREAKGDKKKRRNPEDKTWWLSRVSTPNKKGAVTLVLEVDGKAVGVADIKKNPYPTPHTAFVSIVFIANKYKNKGLGRVLLQSAISEAKKILKIKLITLEVDGVNRYAIKLYRSCKFKQVGRIKKARILYGKYVDRITMVRYLYR